MEHEDKNELKMGIAVGAFCGFISAAVVYRRRYNRLVKDTTKIIDHTNAMMDYIMEMENAENEAEVDKAVDKFNTRLKFFRQVYEY